MLSALKRGLDNVAFLMERNERMDFDVLIIGCGIIGAATAYELSKYDLKVAVLERNNDISDETTKANSGIVHAGYDPAPGSLMAKLNVEGNAVFPQLCRDLQVPFGRVGSLVVAFSEAEMQTVRKLYDRGNQNGVPDLRILDRDELREREPNIAPEAVGALLAPSCGIVNPMELCIALAEIATLNGTRILRESPVTGIETCEGGFLVHTPQQSYTARFVVNAAGVHADAVNDMIAPHTFTIQPVRGEYFLLDKNQGGLANHVIFQCPNQDGKGVLVSPTVHGNLIVGPNATHVEDGDDVATTADGLEFVREHAQKSVPNIQFRENVRNFAGNRAQTEVDDFIIEETQVKGFFNLAGIKSPGLTCAPAIAVMCVELLRHAGLRLLTRIYYCGKREHVCFKTLSAQGKQEAIQRNPLYGRVICRCETITEGEIVDVIHSPVPPVSIDGVKKRCNAGMGRCQGGFCSPRVAEILSREAGIPMLEILQNQAGTELFTRYTKEDCEQ